jgi:ubiquinone/menaquinone biosynthesis C-methylase UbiE
MPLAKSAEEVFDRWALDYHAAGMEDDHRPSVMEAFEFIPESDGVYLEVGVGNGYGLQWIGSHQFKNGTCIGIDVSSNMVEVARSRTKGMQNVSVERADFLNFDPASEDRPDVIFSMEVFYYFPRIEDGLRHSIEILKPSGLLMVLVNHFTERLDSHDWARQLDTPMQLWSASQYHHGFEAAGFIDVMQRYVGIPSDAAARTRNPGTLATWGRKPF